MSFGVKLQDAMRLKGRVCAGIDPHASLLAEWGLPDSVEGLREFSQRALEGLAGAAAIKPQSAFYERFGSAGWAVLEELLRDARSAGVLMILDVKRGDIGSTMAGYGAAFLPEGAPLEADAITIAPYMGASAYDATAALAAQHGKGLFTLALTSNPEGKVLQRSVSADGTAVSAQVMEWTNQVNDLHCAGAGLGSFGVVLGSTVDDMTKVLGSAFSAFNGPILAPGFGAQGADAEDIRRRFAGHEHQVLASSSRGLLKAGPNPAAMQEALVKAVEEVESALA
ncbi:orotidine 5'-phosphate decarboxylase [Gleimia coleocanis DSM 15436]|uniref:Orotidine-5'-phosphate decarboxylase n=1 Tax=Gleimia coleocanis DSM 15436 TaxID=525245 RepID=C0W1L2_9ACTO|nr:orotidine-5'-phosphate decarboxylase [Gleimia coleocanis]EEH63378.1 orotidine 5'-phosphate decarboxylase [Gleimia coleocanis DSM 15436]